MRIRFSVVACCCTVGTALVVAHPLAASGRLAYTESVAMNGTLTVSFNEPGVRKLAFVNYQLKSDVMSTWVCDTGTLGTQLLGQTMTITVVPGGNGHASGGISLAVEHPSSSGCTTPLVLRDVDYTDVTLTNLTTSNVYPLDSIGENLG